MLPTEAAVLQYCLAGPRRRHRLTARELADRLPWLPARLRAAPYAVDGDGSLELIRVDLGGPADHVARKCRVDVVRRLAVPEGERLIAAGRLRLVVLTPTAAKADAIRRSLADRELPDTLTVHLAVDLLVTFAAPTLLALPVLVDADGTRADPRSPGEWDRLVLAVRRSACPIERDSLYLGWVVADGSPVVVPRAVFTEHAHFLGDSGSGKTSLGLLPWLEQTVAFGDSSFVVLDMKGDSGELLATLHAAADRARDHTGRAVPVKHFSTRTDRSTFAYNPLTQPFWDRLDPLARTDHIQNAAGMYYGSGYGSGYGPGYFTSAIGALLHYVLTKHPNVRTFRELADRTRHAVATASPRDLRPEVKKP